MTAGVVFDAAALATVLLLMLAETWLSVGHERRLRARGAVEPAGDVYRAMRVAYPAVFVLMAGEGLRAGPALLQIAVGTTLLLLAKAFKYWAMASLGERWTFRVLVPPGAPAVAGGPYRWVRHPNYVGVLGEIVGFSVLVAAPVTGLLGLVWFGLLLRRRIAVEEQALGLR